jgi:hypothetical protein
MMSTYVREKNKVAVLHNIRTKVHTLGSIQTFPGLAYNVSKIDMRC